MLERLSINNVVLIDKAEIDFKPGFTVLTGETGAGKSILLDSISLITGGRGNADVIGTNNNSASVYAEFNIKNNSTVKEFLNENGFTNDEDIVSVKRLIQNDGKSKAFINDIAASIGNLKELGNSLIEIHGQSEQSNLLQSKFHRQIVDEYSSLTGEVTSLSKIFEELKITRKLLGQLKAEKEKLEKDREYFEFVLDELQKLNIQENEEQQLAEKRLELMNKGKLYEVFKNTLEQITDENNVVRSLMGSQKTLSRNGNLIGPSMKEEVDKVFENLEKAIEASTLVIDNIETLIDNFDTSEATLEDVEERLFKIKELSKKYQRPSIEFPEFEDELLQKLAKIKSNDSEIVHSEILEKKLSDEYMKAAVKISEKRIKNAEKLEKAIAIELKPLKMEGAKFKVEIAPKAAENYNEYGIDDVRFKVSTNPGQPFNDIAKVASGGELSRLMLALKVSISGVKTVPTIIFDEIDTGIGGGVADSVGERLERLGHNAQVLVVTHQPQVASKGHNHLKIAKSLNKGVYKTQIDVLSDDEKLEEVARMLSGATITEEARLAARKLSSK